MCLSWLLDRQIQTEADRQAARARMGQWLQTLHKAIPARFRAELERLGFVRVVDEQSSYPMLAWEYDSEHTTAEPGETHPLDGVKQCLLGDPGFSGSGGCDDQPAWSR